MPIISPKKVAANLDERAMSARICAGCTYAEYLESTEPTGYLSTYHSLRAKANAYQEAAILIRGHHLDEDEPLPRVLHKPVYNELRRVWEVINTETYARVPGIFSEMQAIWVAHELSPQYI